jgi:FkbM family methyltransferase
MLIPFQECIRLSGGKPFEGVLHCGAHLGEEAKDYYDNGVKKVLWVEANKNIMKHLYDNVKMLPMKQMFANEVLGDKDGKDFTFSITNNGQSSSILPLGTHKIHHPQVTVVQTQTVKTKRFDTYYRENRVFLNLFDFDFINIDVQGAELMVLKGFGELFNKFPNIRAIYTEVNEEEVYKGCAQVSEIDTYLSKFGFHRLVTKMTEFRWGDAIYVRK